MLPAVRHLTHPLPGSRSCAAAEHRIPTRLFPRRIDSDALPRRHGSTRGWIRGGRRATAVGRTRVPASGRRSVLVQATPAKGAGRWCGPTCAVPGHRPGRQEHGRWSCSWTAAARPEVGSRQAVRPSPAGETGRVLTGARAEGWIGDLATSTLPWSELTESMTARSICSRRSAGRAGTHPRSENPPSTDNT